MYSRVFQVLTTSPDEHTVSAAFNCLETWSLRCGRCPHEARGAHAVRLVDGHVLPVDVDAEAVDAPDVQEARVQQQRPDLEKHGERVYDTSWSV